MTRFFSLSRPLSLLLFLFVALPDPAAAQYRSANRVAGGLTLVGGGVLMTLASASCRDPRGSDAVLFDGPTIHVGVESVSGGPWLWSRCSFNALFTDRTGELRPLTLSEEQWRDFGSPEFHADRSRDADRVVAAVSRPNYLLRYSGIGLSVLGVMLATVWSGSYDEPVFDVQAGPHGLRFSKTVGF